MPAEFANDRIQAGDLIVVDSGWGDDDEISAVSTRRKQHVTLLHRDGQGVGPLVHATDVTVADDQVYIVDHGESGPGRIFRLEPDWSLTPVAVQIPLQHGWNTLLVKVWNAYGNHFLEPTLTVRLGDHPYDHGMELARYGLWTEAADLLEEGLRDTEFSEYPYRSLATFRLVGGGTPRLLTVALISPRYFGLSGQSRSRLSRSGSAS